MVARVSIYTDLHMSHKNVLSRTLSLHRYTYKYFIIIVCHMSVRDRMVIYDGQLTTDSTFNDNNTALKFFYGSKVFSAWSALGISEQ